MVERCSLRNQQRLPLLQPGRDNNATPPRRPKGREAASSRYPALPTSSSSSSFSATSSSDTSGASRYAINYPMSPLRESGPATTTTSSSVKERAMSSERRRPAATGAERIRTSMRSFSVAFQGEWFSLPVSKVKPPPVTAGAHGVLRKGTPERRTAGSVVTPVKDRRERYRENSRPDDQAQQRWRGRLQGENSQFSTTGFDNDCSDEEKLGGGGGATSWAAIGQPRKSKPDKTVGFKSNSYRESLPSMDTPDRSVILLRGYSRQDQTSPASNSASNPITSPARPNSAKKINPAECPLSSPRTTVFSNWSLPPRLGGVRTASPSKILSSLTGAMLRGLAPAARTGSGEGLPVNDINLCSSPSMMSFAADVRRGKFGESQIDDAHHLRLLYNRHLQWRLANARVESTLLVQKHTSEGRLHDTWASTSRMRRSVKSKRIELQLSRHNLKLHSILKEQERHLEDWGLLERDHINSLADAIAALEACTIRLPVVCAAKVDFKKVQGALSSSVYLMQAISSFIQSSSTEVERMRLLVSELSNLRETERGLLEECKDTLSTFMPLQVACGSLIAHKLQVQRVATGKTTRRG